MQHGSCLSFRDLFQLARGRPWTTEEERLFQGLDQEARNQAVKLLAAEAGCIRTEDRLGTDKKVYTAFWMDELSAR